MSEGTGRVAIPGLKEANDKLIELLGRQKRLADEYRELLTAPDGLIENTRLTCRNLDAAVVQAKQPGYFRYHTPSAKVKQIESGKLLAEKARAIAAVERDIEKAKADVEAVKARAAEAAAAGSTVPVTSLDQWFSVYKRPSATYGADGFTTTFVPSTKVYGGSTHYDAFKSVATTMKTGRLTK